MSNFYLYNESVELGNERCETLGKHIFRNCTIRKVNNFVKRINYTNYSIYSFTNFYDNSTFKLIKRTSL